AGRALACERAGPVSTQPFPVEQAHTPRPRARPSARRDRDVLLGCTGARDGPTPGTRAVTSERETVAIGDLLCRGEAAENGHYANREDGLKVPHRPMRTVSWISLSRRFAKAARDYRTGRKLNDFRPVFYWFLGWRWLPDDGRWTAFGHSRADSNVCLMGTHRATL